MGTTTRYTAGEVMPTVKDSLGYVGIGAKQATCPKCGETNAAEANSATTAGPRSAAAAPRAATRTQQARAFCSACGKPLTA